MARPNDGPRWYESKQAWYVTVGGVTHRLGTDKKVAKLKYRKLLDAAVEGRDGDAEAVDEVLERWLEEKGATNAKSGNKMRRFLLQPFLDQYGDKVVYSLKIAHIHEFISAQRKRGWGKGTIRSFISVLKAAFNWLYLHDYISVNPAKNLQRLPAQARDASCVVTAEEHKLLHSQAPAALADVLEAMWLTGSRPGALLVAEARDLNGTRLHIAGREGIKKKSITLYLSPRALDLFQRLAKEHPTGPLFRNRFGAPWDQRLLNLALETTRERCGCNHVTPYSYRHAYISRLVVAGESIAMIATLTNTSPTYIEKVYGHLSTHTNVLQALADRY